MAASILVDILFL